LSTREERQKGKIKSSTLRGYLKEVGCLPIFSVLFFLLTMQTSRILVDFFIAFWASHPSEDKNRNIKILSVLVVLNVVLTSLRGFSFAYACLKAAMKIHNKLFASVIGATLKFHDSTPRGVIYN
jgi:ABC-type multidrug transport system fused ATPase/permease subunit